MSSSSSEQTDSQPDKLMKSNLEDGEKGEACPTGEKGETTGESSARDKEAEDKSSTEQTESEPDKPKSGPEDGEQAEACPTGESSTRDKGAEEKSSSSSQQTESQPKKLKSSLEDGEQAQACATGESSAPDSADTGDAEGNYHKMAISPVVHVRGLTESVVEAELVKAIAKFGTICYVSMMPFKQEALVEFENTEFSKMCVTSAKNQPIFIGGQQASFSYSTSKKITRSANIEDTFGGSNVLLISIYNADYPVSVDIIYSVFNPLGKVERIVIFRRNAIKAMVEFKTVYGAQKARAALNGTDLFPGCGKLNIEYARPSRLNVFRNNNDSWDYSKTSMNKPDQGNEPQGQAFQGNQPPFHNQGNGPQGQAFQGNQPPFQNQGNGPQGQPFQGNRPPFHNQGNGPQGQPFQGNQPPFSNQGNMPQRQPFQGNRTPFTRFDGYNQGNQGFQGNHPPFQNFGGYNQGNEQQMQAFQGNHPPNYPPNQPPFQRFDGYGNPGPMVPFPNQNTMGPGDNPEMASFPQTCPPFMQSGPTGGIGGIVAMIGGLHQEKMNCDRVFSLFCLYGNVSKVKFMKSIPGTALVEMTDEFAVQRAVSNLNMVQIFGKTVSVCVSKQYSVVPSHMFYLQDGTSSYKDFSMSKLNRFTIATQPSKNLMQPPSCVLRYYNVPLKTTESNFQKLCEELKVPKFIKHKAFDPRPPSKNGSGLLQWKMQAEAMEALLVLNHYQIRVPYNLNPYTLKLSFYTTTRL
ncbi:heterogeneous nuclear ribonucleoprotein L-like isoform X17 [Phyllobates terribilis]|uniref:heterogeneous nuclear ribonucleoprotein L-like isoform X17 n=1 Tax=Phyllobates terribilis TaxID=111132 RepID=UPI003CCA8583